MKQYHKIQTVWLRDPEDKYKTLLEGQWAKPEFEMLQNMQWRFFEKVDGTNIRLMWDRKLKKLTYEDISDEEKLRELDPKSPILSQMTLSFKGKTDKAEIPPRLQKRLEEMFNEDMFKEVFGETPVCLYGEGYGATIQKGGGDYISNGVSFILFDVKIGLWWLKYEDVVQTAKRFRIPAVPLIRCGTLHEAIEMTRKGFPSQLRLTAPEGLVMKPQYDLFDRRGDRIISKIKGKDFE